MQRSAALDRDLDRPPLTSVGVARFLEMEMELGSANEQRRWELCGVMGGVVDAQLSLRSCLVRV